LEVALESRPPVISLALGDAGDMVERAHAVGSLFVQQVHTVPRLARPMQSSPRTTRTGQLAWWTTGCETLPISAR
jgi:hypothetical protein